jgi:hypothetical protein
MQASFLKEASDYFITNTEAALAILLFAIFSHSITLSEILLRIPRRFMVAFRPGNAVRPAQLLQPGS